MVEAKIYRVVDENFEVTYFIDINAEPKDEKQIIFHIGNKVNELVSYLAKFEFDKPINMETAKKIGSFKDWSYENLADKIVKRITLDLMPI